ncbi:MAG: hypothetical protein H0W15_01305 [Gemmatimonadales bacterium]|nr:hypothetical protein [Gemmatimonadales bacterium]
MMMVIAGNPRTGTPEANMSAWEASVEASLYSTMRRKFDDDGEEQFDVDEFDFDDEDEDVDDDDDNEEKDDDEDSDDEESTDDDLSFDDEDRDR